MSDVTQIDREAADRFFAGHILGNEGTRRLERLLADYRIAAEKAVLDRLRNSFAGHIGAAVDTINQDIAELPDRDSTDDWPEAMMVTHEENAIICERNIMWLFDIALADALEAKPNKPPRQFLTTRTQGDCNSGMDNQ